MSVESTNPKDKIGRTKPNLHLIPAAAMIEEAGVMALGAKKYGPYNWRDKSVSGVVYISAAMRHLLQWLDGETIDAESGCSHLAHARACMGIMLDAGATGNMIDDRPKPGVASALIAEKTQVSEPKGESPSVAPAEPRFGVSEGDAVLSDYGVEDLINGGANNQLAPNSVDLYAVYDTCTAKHANHLEDALKLQLVGSDRSRIIGSVKRAVRYSRSYRLRNGLLPFRTVYIAGPMRGHPDLNFPEFDAAVEFVAETFGAVAVISPADVDRDLEKDVPFEDNAETRAKYCRRDLAIIQSMDPLNGDFIFALKGADESVGASAEIAVARWLGLPIFRSHKSLIRVS
jgi:hypothetical protein